MEGQTLLKLGKGNIVKVLKAMYFSNIDFLSCKIKSGSSFVWKSFLWGCEVIKTSSRWKVDNGRSIFIYTDNWMPRPLSFKPISSKTLSSDSEVWDLLINGNEWNKQFIKSNFLPIDAELILKISLPRVPANDTLVWHYEKRRFDTVKNGYQVALRLAYPNSPSSSFGSVNWCIPLGFYPFQWFHLKSKKKILRALRNILPTFK